MLERRPPDEQPTAPLPVAAHAAVSPWGLGLAGAGALASLAVGAPVVLAVVIGAGVWAARVGLVSARAAGRRRRALRPEPIDPYAVPDPWRRFVRESLTAQTKFDQAVARVRTGPLRDRLEEVAGRVHDGVREVWRVAHLGAALDAARAGIDPEATSDELARFQDQHRERGPAGDSTEQTEAALAARLQAGRRVEAAAQRATDRLRVLTAELNAAVASAVELSLDASDPADASELSGSVDSVVGEIESLRQALEEAAGSPNQAPGAPGTPRATGAP